MLLQKVSDQVTTFKTTYGEEIISRISEQTETEYVLNKPMVLVTTSKGGFGLAPVVFSVPSSANLRLNKAAVVLTGPTEKELADQYLSQTTGITII